SADPIPDVIPTEFSITSTYPNPFNATLSIQYDIPQAAQISLSVYDLLGREVATLFQGMKDPGRHAVFWNAEGVSTGVYFIRLHSEHRSATQKVLLLK
ncbi:T9SS type A sorting domain-containing protein, partial [bacterium]|nr:T9SS type A sorting domain-containing protein [bacterium]